MSNYKYNSSSCVITKLISKDILKIFEFISFGVALFDDAKRLVYYNKTLRNMLNATCVDNMSDLIMNLTNSKMLRKGSSFSPIHSPISRIGKICDLLDKLRSEDMEQHCEFITEDKTIWVKGKLIILNEEVKYIITFADVTLQRECEMLKEINKLKSKIISSLSHEFRNPLHNILDSLNNCQKEPSELKQNIRIANSNAHIMLYKVNDLLVL
jgi:signal transduction histidine kinase